MKLEKYLWVGLLFVVLSLHNCTAAILGAGAGAGLGTYSYFKGELKLDYPYPYDRTWNASLTAMERLEIEVITQGRDALAGKITGKRADGKAVVIKVKDKGLGVTTVIVRVGTFGDREVSRKIQETILNVLRG